GDIMSSAHVTYDARSGRIVGVHHGPVDIEYVRRRMEHYSKMKPYIDLGKENVATITINSSDFKPGKTYKVDVHHKKLIEAAGTDGGVGLCYGAAGRSA